MKNKDFQELFEMHVRTQKVNLEKKTDYLRFPLLSVYTAKRYDGTMGNINLTLQSLDYSEQSICIRDYGKQLQEIDAFKGQVMGAAFLSMRSFYDTTKVKGNQVLQIYGLSTLGEVGESMTEMPETGEFTNTLGVFGLLDKNSGKQIGQLAGFFMGAGIALPQFVNIKDMLTPRKLVDYIVPAEIIT